MSFFSEREGITSRQAITDDAPVWLRKGFFNQVLKDFLHLDRSNNPFADATDAIESPIGVKSLIEKISVRTKTLTPANYKIDAVSLLALEDQLSVIPWFHFYNSVELVAELLLGLDNRSDNRAYGIGYFRKFRKGTNDLFDEGDVGWQLDESGKLQRNLPVEVTHLEHSIVSASGNSPAAAHILKARKFINEHPCDAGNAIKESVSAVESFARTLDPRASTLGDVIPRLKSNNSYPALLLSVIEKLYGFASAEPGVRHGSPEEERVLRSDAEFVYVTSLAIIRYLKDVRK
jgi:hypothetical protein